VELSSLVAAMEARLPAILADTEELVKCESPSADLEAVARSADMVAAVGARHLGSAAERIVIDGRTHLRWRLGEGPARVLLLCHHDTVWPLGSLETHPYTVSDGVMRGPGCVDMKAGIVLGLHALAQLGVPGGVTLLVTGDEEIGSPSSRALIESEAAGCSAALVLESAANDGALKTERKGVSLYQVRAVGRAAHAGLEPERGVNATLELAHQVLAVAGFVTLILVPQIKYPANPPSIGDPETIGPRTALYFTMIVLSVIAAVGALSTGRQLVRRLGAWNSALVAGAAYVAVITAGMLILPPVNEVPSDFSATTLWNFRLASLGIELVLWTTLGLAFGLLAERQFSPGKTAARRIAQSVR